MVQIEEHMPIIEVTDVNLKTVWPLLMSAIKEASFIAIDTVSGGLMCSLFNSEWH